MKLFETMLQLPVFLDVKPHIEGKISLFFEHCALALFDARRRNLLVSAMLCILAPSLGPKATSN